MATATESRPYRPPQLLRDVLLLDMLELTGSTQRASHHLALSQPSVSRRYQRLARDFGLRRDSRQRLGFRYGSSGSIRHLRLAARAHRIEAGLPALGSDLLHRQLLRDLRLRGAESLLLPSRFLSGAAWAHLLREGVVDGVLVPCLEHEDGALRDGGRERRWQGVRLLDLGCVPLTPLAPPGASAAAVLAPGREQAPGLVAMLEEHGLVLSTAPRRLQEWSGWLELLESRRLRMLLPAGAAGLAPREASAARLAVTPPLAGVRERLWLLLAEELDGSPVEGNLLRGLRGVIDPPTAQSAAAPMVS